MQEQINKLTREMDEVKRLLKSLEANATIPFLIGEAFKTRLGSNIQSQTPTTNKSLKTVNEAGSATYDVSDKMDGKLPVVINNTVYYIPYYNS